MVGLIVRLEGVRKCILHSVWQAQGKAARRSDRRSIGGDPPVVIVQAKEQLFRTFDDTNPDPGLAELEAVDHGQVNRWAWERWDSAERIAHWVQNHGGESASGQLLRVVAYDCWAFRRLGVVLTRRVAPSRVAVSRR